MPPVTQALGLVVSLGMRISSAEKQQLRTPFKRLHEPHMCHCLLTFIIAMRPDKWSDMVPKFISVQRDLVDLLNIVEDKDKSWQRSIAASLCIAG